MVHQSDLTRAEDRPKRGRKPDINAAQRAGLEAVVEAAGGYPYRIYKRLTAAGYEIGRQAPGNWRRVPSRWVLPVERELGVHRSVQRPDLYPPDEYPPEAHGECAA